VNFLLGGRFVFFFCAKNSINRSETCCLFVQYFAVMTVGEDWVKRAQFKFKNHMKKGSYGLIVKEFRGKKCTHVGEGVSHDWFENVFEHAWTRHGLNCIAQASNNRQTHHLLMFSSHDQGITWKLQHDFQIDIGEEDDDEDDVKLDEHDDDTQQSLSRLLARDGFVEEGFVIIGTDSDQWDSDGGEIEMADGDEEGGDSEGEQKSDVDESENESENEEENEEENESENDDESDDEENDEDESDDDENEEEDGDESEHDVIIWVRNILSKRK